MAINTRTIGQLNSRPVPLVGDILEIQVASGISFKITVQQLATFVGSIPFQSIKFNKITTPSDPPLEEGIAYLRTIDGTNNGLFIKIKKAGVISEVQIA